MQALHHAMSHIELEDTLCIYLLRMRLYLAVALRVAAVSLVQKLRENGSLSFGVSVS